MAGSATVVQRSGASSGGGGVVVVGSANVDVTVRVERLPAPGATVLGGDVARRAGGKGLNQAVAAARAGAAAAFVGAVGHDPDADLLGEALAAAGVDVTHLRRVDRPTGVALIAVDPAGENQIVVGQGANAAVDADVVAAAAELVAGAAVVLTQLEVDVSALVALRRTARRLVLNPAPARRLDPEDLEVAVLVPNAGELAALVGGPEPCGADEAVTAAQRLQGPASVVATLGALGAVAVEGDRHAWIRPPDGIDVVDATAAGDTLCGYLAAALAEGATLEEAARLGVAAASLAVGREGAAGSVPWRHELG